jgi:hypothetical protein
MRVKRTGANGNRGETTRGERELGRNESGGRTGFGANRPGTAINQLIKESDHKIVGENTIRNSHLSTFLVSI